MAGTPTSLYQHLLSDTNEDPEFLPAFLFGYTVFLDTALLFEWLLNDHAVFMRTHNFASGRVSTGHVDSIHELRELVPAQHARELRVHQRVCFVLVAVLARQWTSAVDDALLHRLHEVVRDLISMERTEMAAQIREQLLVRDSEQVVRAPSEGAGHGSEVVDTPPHALEVSAGRGRILPPAARAVCISRLAVWDLPSMALAKELTRRDFHLFKQVCTRGVVPVRRHDASPAVLGLQCSRCNF